MQHEFKTHSFSFIQQGEWVVFDFTLNSDIYFEMQLSSRACEFGNSIKEQNNRALINMFSMFGVQPNLEYLFKPTPIENERYLIYRFIKSILQDDNPRLVQFESENEYRYFCDSHNITAEQQIWFKRIYVNDNITGRGIGSKCMGSLKHWLHQKGYTRFDTDTALSNEIAQYYYEKNEFIREGITRSYYL